MDLQAAARHSQGPEPRELEEAPATILEQTPRMIQEVKSTDNKRQQTASLEQSADKPSSLSSWATRASQAPGEEAS